jgi:hypothetical protein
MCAPVFVMMYKEDLVGIFSTRDMAEKYAKWMGYKWSMFGQVGYNIFEVILDKPWADVGNA